MNKSCEIKADRESNHAAPSGEVERQVHVSHFDQSRRLTAAAHEVETIYLKFMKSKQLERRALALLCVSMVILQQPLASAHLQISLGLLDRDRRELILTKKVIQSGFELLL